MKLHVCQQVPGTYQACAHLVLSSPTCTNTMDFELHPKRVHTVLWIQTTHWTVSTRNPGRVIVEQYDCRVDDGRLSKQDQSWLKLALPHLLLLCHLLRPRCWACAIVTFCSCIHRLCCHAFAKHVSLGGCKSSTAVHFVVRIDAGASFALCSRAAACFHLQQPSEFLVSLPRAL